MFRQQKFVERANSQAKLNVVDRRDHMHPETLHLIMLLKLNKSLWPIESKVQEILDLQQESQQDESDEDEEESEDEQSEDERAEDEQSEDEEREHEVIICIEVY